MCDFPRKTRVGLWLAYGLAYGWLMVGLWLAYGKLISGRLAGQAGWLLELAVLTGWLAGRLAG